MSTWKSRISGISVLGLAAMLVCGQAGAVTYTLNFTQAGALMPINTGTTVGNQVALNNVATGNSTIPSFTMLAGDVLNVSLMLSSGITIVPGNSAEITLGIRPATGNSTSNPGSGFYSQVVSFLNNGVVVPAPSVFSFYVGSGGFLAAGGRTVAALPSSFSFNSATFNLTVATGSSFVVGGSGFGTTTLLAQTVLPVPEPASGALVLAGMAVIGLAAGRRRQTPTDGAAGVMP